MSKAKILAQGAEAIISLEDDKIFKKRVKKSYRLKELDEKLRKLRTRSESRIMEKLKDIIEIPKIFDVNEEKKEIIMEFVDGKKLSENFEKLNWKKICKQIGETITKIHDKNIIHGDLTTSNMIYVENLNKESNSNPILNNFNINKITAKKASMRGFEADKLKPSASEASANNHLKVYIIDFGLAFHSHKIEDKAVDLHLLKQALEAKHFEIADEAIKIILDNYKPYRYQEILEKLKIVEARGRYKERV